MSKRVKPDYAFITFPNVHDRGQMLCYQAFNLDGEYGVGDDWDVEEHSDLEPIVRRITAIILMDLRRALEPD